METTTIQQAFKKYDREMSKYNRLLRAAVLAVAPEAERTAGIGWCGPNWQAAEKADRDFRAANTHPVVA